jgi:hypothetical protein
MEKQFYLKNLPAKAFLSVTLLFNVTLNLLAQTDSIQNDRKKNYFSISASYQPGTILPTTDFVKGNNMAGHPLEKYENYSVKLLWQNPGYTDWQKVFRVPYYGAGVSLGNFYNPEEIGYPVSVYGILGIPIMRVKKFELYSEMQFGAAFNWEKYDSISNPKNKVIGGGMTVHLNLGLNAFYPLTKNLDLGAGISFIHFSNGGFERPNNGFNIYAPSVEMKYHFDGRPNAKMVTKAGKLERSHELFLMLGYGDHQLIEHELDTNYFAVGGISAIYFNRFSNAARIGLGTDINYWWGLNANSDGTPGPYSFENMTVGLILQPEVIIGRLSLVSGFGIYARHRNYGSFKQTYQRLGVRFDVYKNFSAGINVRAINFTEAEFLEFNFGYRFKWKY